MKKHFKYIFSRFFFCSLVLSCVQSYGQNFLELKDDKIENYIGNYIEVLTDNKGIFTINDVLKSTGFKKSNSNVPNFGVTENTNWIKFTAVNLSDKKEFIVQLALATIDYVDCYSVYEDGRIDSVKTGDCRTINNRPLGRPDFAFKLSFNKNEKVKLFIKVRGGEQIQTPVNVGEQTLMLKSFINEDTLMGVYFGIILVMFLYNTFIFFSTRDKSYLFYVIYILIVGVTQLNFMGYASVYLWPESVYVSNIAVYVLSSITAISSIEFLKRFLSTKDKCPQLHKYFILFYFIYYIAIALAFFKKFNWSYQIIQINATLAATYILVVAVKISNQGYRPARFFLLAWSTFLIGVCVFVFKDFGILPYHKITYYMMPIGSAFEVILLSLALADRINILRKEKEESQLKTLELLQENQNIVLEQKASLEIKVKERTAELETSNRNLREAESQLINVEKMASLGQLTAGISHEINNPINFVVSNVEPLKRDVEDILHLLAKYNEIKNDSDIDKKLKEINDLKEKLDIGYLINEVNLLLNGIKEGAHRTAEIVKGLKTFSRTDEYDIKKMDVHQGINATLALLNHTITKENINIVKEYENIPPIECYPGKLNQVFMNLLNNAIQAVKANSKEGKQNTIILKTSGVNNSITISIKDNGIGISQKNLSKIFEPFFTTKEVGMGTGLGLSIVYGIIKSHYGEINAESVENVGTEFIIKLPIQLNKI